MFNYSLWFFCFLIFILCVVIGFCILIILGNLTAMKILAKCGVAVFSHKILKDYALLDYVNKEGIGWISIPEVCYAPVMKYSNGKYINHNFLQKENRYGELYLSNGKRDEKLKELSLDIKEGISDLSVIKGAAIGTGTNLRHSNFSCLRKLERAIKDNLNVEVQVCDKDKIRYFKPVCLLELGLEEKHKFQYENRNDFIQSILNLSKVKNIEKVPKSHILFLECKTDVDTVFVMLMEKEKK